MQAANEGMATVKIEPCEAPIEIRITDTNFESTRLCPRRSQSSDICTPGPGCSSENNMGSAGVSPRCNGVIVSPMATNVASTLFDNGATTYDQTNAESSEIVRERAAFKQEFTSLNSRLGAYMQKVREKEYLLEELSKARTEVENQLQQVREESNQQINMLRSEVERHVKQAVELEATIDRLQRDVNGSQRERDMMRAELAEKRKRELSLERQVVSEHSQVRSLREENAKFREQRKKDEEDRLKLNETVTRLKVEIATLQERVKIASFELTMQESKVVEAEKKLVFSADDVNKRVAAERSRLEKLGMAKLEEMALKHQTEIERTKREHTRKMQDALLTYVTGEEHARLSTRFEETLKRAEAAEAQLAERNELLNNVRNELEQLKSVKENEVAAERRKRDKLNKRLTAQKQCYDELCQEVDIYRKLIESLDINSEILTNTPVGAKRPRTAVDQVGGSRTEETFLLAGPSATGTPVTAAALKARQLLLRKALTPKSKAPQREGESPNSEEASNVDVKPDCKMM